MCLDYSCLDSALIPCVATDTCQPANVACNGLCPTAGYSVCPTTGLCHVTTLAESCDSSNITCLVGQTLVQRTDSVRYCAVTAILPVVAASCTNGTVYCEDLGVCMNLSAPNLCRACPGRLQLCPNTSDCVSDLAECCGSDEEQFCAVLNRCLQAGVRCELPNIAPVVTSDLIYLDSLRAFDEDVYSGEGYVISVLLGDPAVDSQGEELSVALTATSDVSATEGEWQFALGSNTDWQRINSSDLSESNALLLPSTARLRFMKRAVELDGAVWIRAKLWDGNADGFLSPRQDLVRTADPGFSSTVPFSADGAFSQSSTLLVVLIHPQISPPFFSPLATRQFTSIQEDVLFSRNFGDSLSDLIVAVTFPDFAVLSTDSVEGFPESPTRPYEELLPEEVRGEYYDVIGRVNPTRVEREQARASGQLPGVAVMLDSANDTSSAGEWQVAFSNVPRQFLGLESLLLSAESSNMVLLNTTAGLRFLPDPDFCGAASILLAPWDGFWNTSVATPLGNGYIVSSFSGNGQGSSLTQYNLNSWWRATITVECVPDRPQALESDFHIAPIPYRIAYRYERLFTVLVEREISSLRQEQELFSNYLHIVLQHSVTLERFAPALERRYVTP